MRRHKKSLTPEEAVKAYEHFKVRARQRTTEWSKYRSARAASVKGADAWSAYYDGYADSDPRGWSEHDW